MVCDRDLMFSVAVVSCSWSMVSRYATLADFLACQMLTIDATTDDGWGASMPVKGREIDATVVFADIAGSSARTAELGAAETLAFVNHFFAWISAEALRHGPGIVDKYIGDEVMVIFSDEFGSEDPLLDAIYAALGMGQNDVYAFMPHIGIASGRVIVGYVGTPQGYSTSVFGAPVATAARCAGVPLPEDLGTPISTYMTLPASEIDGRDFAELIPETREVPGRRGQQAASRLAAAGSPCGFDEEHGRGRGRSDCARGHVAPQRKRRGSCTDRGTSRRTGGATLDPGV